MNRERDRCSDAGVGWGSSRLPRALLAGRPQAGAALLRSVFYFSAPPPTPWADSPQGPVQFEYSYFIERTERPPCPSQAHRILIHGATAWRQVGLHAAAQKIDHLRFPREPVAASPAQVRHQELRCLQGPRCRKKQELGQRLYKHNCGGESLAGAAPYQTGSGSTRRTAPWGGDAGFIT